MTSKKNIIPVEDVKRLFDYRADGALIWRERPLSDFATERAWKIWNRRFSGAEAGYINGKGYRYVRITLDGKTRQYKAHRLVFAWHNGVFPAEEIDHKNHDKLDNKIENLRAVSRAENNRNASLRFDSTTGVCGVYWYKRDKKWMAHIQIDKKKINLGYFEDFDDAVAARKSAEKKFGFHRRHGLAQ